MHIDRSVCANPTFSESYIHIYYIVIQIFGGDAFENIDDL